MTSETETSSTTLGQCSSQLGKPKLKLQQVKAKKLLQHHVVAAKFSRQVEEAIDEIISRSAALL
jgi:hypothetical protein